MKNIFATYNEKFVKSVELFYDSTTGILYTDSDKEKPISKGDLELLFKKGLVLINDGTGLIRPTAFGKETAYSYVSVVSIVSTAATETKFYSDGYTAG